MKSAPGLTFTLGALVLLGSGLVAGQVWALTGSTPMAAAAGAASAVALGLAARRLARRIATGRRPVLGDYRGLVDQREFVDVVEAAGDGGPRAAIQRGLRQSPERVAGSIRSLLDRDPARPAKGGGRR